MAAKTKATAVKISERDAHGYHYAGQGMRRNGGVTAIAAINGRGAYAANLKAREVTEGKPPSAARRAAGKALDYITQEPLVIRMHPIRKLQKKLTTKVENRIARSESPMLNKNPSRRGKRPATPAQLRARKKFAEMAKAGVFNKTLRKNGSRTAASWAKPSLGSLEKVRRMRRNAARVIPGERRRSVVGPGALPRFAMPGEGIDLEARTKVMPRRSIKATAKPRTGRKTRKIRSSQSTRKAPTAKASARAQEKPMKTRKRRSKASAAAKVSTAKRRIKAKKVGTVKVSKAVKRSRAAKKAARTRKANALKRSVAAKKAARTRKAAPKRRKAAKVRSAAPKSVRKATKRKARRTAKQKAAARKNLRKAHASLRSAAPKRRRKAARRSVRKTTSKAVRRTRRTRARKGFRKNGRFTHGRMKRNEGLGAFSTALKVGTVAGIGFFAHKVSTALLNGLIIDKAVSATVQAAAESSATAPAAAGLGAFSPLIGGFIGGGATLALGIFLSGKFIESEDTRRLVTAGMVASYAQTLLVSLLEKVAPQAAPMLSGGEASRMSAMYGVDPSSILPRYAPINGMRGVGEYFAPTNGLGEYFAPTAGLGEYFAQSGLGSYEGNPNIMQAAAGYGALNGPTNHLDPSSDLERELSIAEAAAGVGNIDYAAAGMGDIYQASAGFGAISTVPSTDTNIPSGQLWAGVRSVEAGDNSESPAGILSTSGGSGIFG